MGVRAIRLAEETIGDLDPEDEIRILGRGGWEMLIQKIKTQEFDFTHQNIATGVPGKPDTHKFFDYTTKNNRYGAGKIIQEPSLGVPLSRCGVNSEGRIIGALVLDDASNIKERFSWSNIVFAQSKTFGIAPNGELTVNGVSKGFLHTGFVPDKNRMDGRVGVFTPRKPDEVQLLEMEDILLKSIIK